MNFKADSKVLIQGIVESLGKTHTNLMKAYGTKAIAGVSPGYGGQQFEDLPIFDMVEQALSEVGPVDTTVIFVPPYSVLDAALEAIAAGIKQIIIVTEGVPPLDLVNLVRKAEATETLVVGPNTPGVIVPGKVLLGIHPQQFYTPGKIGLISRSGTLTYEVANELTKAGLGQSIGVGIGGDAIVGSSFAQWLQILDEDDDTEAIVLVGEVGSGGEEAAAAYIEEAIDKPVVAYLAGNSAPKGKRLGHAGDLIAAQLSVGSTDKVRPIGADPETAQKKLAAFKSAKIPVAERPSDIPNLLKKSLKQTGKKK